MAQNEKRIAKYRKELDEGKMMAKITGVDHICRHVERTDVDVIERILSGNCRRSGVFTDKESADAFIDETLYNKMPEIVDWLENGTSKQTAVVVSFEGEVTGTSIAQYRNEITEWEDDSITVVLERSPYNYGFELKTAYPSASPNSKKTNRDLTPILKQTRQYMKANPVEQTYMEYQVNQTPIHVNKYQSPNGTELLQISILIPDKDMRYNINIGTRPENCNIICKTPKLGTTTQIQTSYMFPKSKIADELRTQYPDVMEIADTLYESIQNKIKNRRQNTLQLEQKIKQSQTEQTTYIQLE